MADRDHDLGVTQEEAIESSGCAPVLELVMPVHNEATVLHDVVLSWVNTLSRRGIDYRIVIYDDGSSDGSAEIASALAKEHTAVVAVRQDNRGHGPTVTRGYRASRALWVLQVDGDGEVPAMVFQQLWTLREPHDLVIAVRRDRRSHIDRRMLTAATRIVLRLLYGVALADPNSPCRLFRGAALRELLPYLPDDAAVPNVVLAGLAGIHGRRIAEVDAWSGSSRPSTLSGLRLWRSAARGLCEAVQTALVARFAAGER